MFPQGVDWDRNLSAIDQERAKKKSKGVDTVYWGSGSNNKIQCGKLYVKGETIELWAGGAKPKEG